MPFRVFFYWFALAALVGLTLAFAIIATLAVKRVPNPAAVIRQSLEGRSRSILIGMFLVAVDFTAFGYLKPELDLRGFSADMMLARFGHAIFGTYGWRAFSWARHPFMGEAYHAVWLAWLFFVLILLFWQPASARKSTAIIAYFLLWVVGPLVHLAMPAAGPVLYDSIFHANDFAGLAVVPADSEKFNYLLAGYTSHAFSPAGGISAMPSLHIATMAWAVAVCWPWRGLRSAAIVITVYMWVASVALGWHYFLDGAAGILVALVAWATAARTSGRAANPDFGATLQELAASGPPPQALIGATARPSRSASS
jgi:hypothetical protein